MVSVDDTLVKTKPLSNPDEIKLWTRPATIAADMPSYPEARPTTDVFVM